MPIVFQYVVVILVTQKVAKEPLGWHFWSEVRLHTVHVPATNEVIVEEGIDITLLSNRFPSYTVIPLEPSLVSA